MGYWATGHEANLFNATVFPEPCHVHRTTVGRDPFTPREEDSTLAPERAAPVEKALPELPLAQAEMNPRQTVCRQRGSTRGPPPWRKKARV